LQTTLQIKNKELEKAKKDAEAKKPSKIRIFNQYEHEIRIPLKGMIGFTDLIQRTQHSP
jgi:two-component system sensor histidine kinase BarA